MDVYQAGDTATNPATGEKLTFDGAGWKPATAGKVAPEAKPAPNVSTAQDIKQTIAPSLERGFAGLVTAPPAMYDLAKKGIEWGINKLPEGAAQGAREGMATAERMNPANPLIQAMPRYEDVQKRIENSSGPLYQAQTPIGKGVQTGLEMAPAAMSGGGSVVGKAVRGLGAAAGSETAGQLSEGTPYEPYARLGGAIGGSTLPSMVRALRTPFPTSPERETQGNLLKSSGVDATAGQLTGSPTLRRIEGNLSGSTGAPSWIGPEEQGRQMTRTMLKEMGVDSDTTLPNVIGKGKGKLGQGFDEISARNTIGFDASNPSDPLIAKLNQTRSWYNSRVPAEKQSPLVEQEINKIIHGPSGKPSAKSTMMGMSGERYQETRSSLSADAERIAKKDPNTSHALKQVRDALDEAMRRSVPAEEAAAWDLLRDQWGNARALEKASTAKGQLPASGQLNSGSVYQALKDKESNLGQVSRAGEAIMRPLPKGEGAGGGAFSRVLGGVLGGGAGSAMGLTGEGPVLSAYFGQSYFPDLVKLLTSNPATARAVFSKPAQGYLANQAWRPGPVTSTDMAQLVRVLASRPPQQGPQ